MMLPRQRSFKQVDVFTDTAYLGNPLAVVLDGVGLTDAQMLRFANWTNLSETTFLLPPTEAGAAAGADYRVRIFCPSGEMQFAGHPTLGSCHAWLESGGLSRNKSSNGEIIQECAKGLIRIQRIKGQSKEQSTHSLAFAAPQMTRSAPSVVTLSKVAAALGLKSQQIQATQLLDNGTVWLGLLLQDADTVLALTPNFLELSRLGLKIGVAGVYEQEYASQLIAKSSREARAFGANSAHNQTTQASADVEIRVEIRAFAPSEGTNEDPVTGSLNASLAQWLIEDGYLPQSYLASQGLCLDRAGRVSINRDESGQVWVGGNVVTCIDGMVEL